MFSISTVLIDERGRYGKGGFVYVSHEAKNMYWPVIAISS